MNLKDTTNIASVTTVSIPVVTNSGRKGQIVTSDAGSYLKIEGSDFWDVQDGYLHLDMDRHMEYLYSKYAVIGAVKKMVVLYFAGKLKIKNSLFTKVKKVIGGVEYDICVPMDCPPLGGTWQAYFTNNDWIKEAEKIKGDKIYLS